MFEPPPQQDGEDAAAYTSRIMAGNEFDNAALMVGAAGLAESPVLEEGDPDDIAAQIGLTAEEALEFEELLEDDHHNDYYGD